ncbi:hypothetical protein HK102_010000, partial [Quaeritorhiza haematococci]
AVSTSSSFSTKKKNTKPGASANSAASKRDKQERESYALEQAEKERRRNMTDAEIGADHEELRPKN